MNKSISNLSVVTLMSIIIVLVYSLGVIVGEHLENKEPTNYTIGKVSWYGGGEDLGEEILNDKTATGEKFDHTAYTCASYLYLPNTMLKVTNIENGKSVVVRVNDLGPRKDLGRAVDLTRTAFQQIADLNDGIITVKIVNLKGEK